MSDFNILTRGQSNAYLFKDNGSWKMEQDFEAQTGKSVDLIQDYDNSDGAATIFSATRFMDWDTDGQQDSLINQIHQMSAEQRAKPTAINWMHNEYDQQTDSLTTEQWVAEVRADAALVREALGQDAATTPYVFSVVPYNYGGNQKAITDGMQQLIDDPSFNAHWGVDMNDLKMDGDGYAGSSHMGQADAVLVGERLADRMGEILGSTGTAAPQPTAPAQPTEVTVSDSSFDVVFQDDFENGYKRENWGDPFHGGDYGGKGVWGWDASQVNVVNHDGDGALEVSMTRQSDGYWLGGGLNSFKAGQTITYGKFEFDAKVEEGQGTMGVILTWPESDVWPRDGEIDILEAPGTETMHTVHWEGDGGADWFDAKRGEFYDETQWNHYEVTWLPERLTIEVNDQVVAEWTDPAMIPDVAHGLGAMGNVAGPHDDWMGGPPDASTPGKVSVYMDNVVVKQWNGGDPANEGSTPAPTTPTPQPSAPSTPSPAPVQGEVATGYNPAPTGVQTGGAGPDTLQLWVSGDAYQGDPRMVVFVDGQQIGGEFTITADHGASAQAINILGDFGPGQHDVAVKFLNDKYDGSADTDRNLHVDGALYNGVAINGAEQAVMGHTGDGKFAFTDAAPAPATPATPAPEAPAPVTPPPAPTTPAPEAPATGGEGAEIAGGKSADTLNLNKLFGITVDGGDGADRIMLGEDHGDVTLILRSGQTDGDVITGFGADDALEFVGFGEGAQVEALGNGDFRVHGGAYGHDELFTVTGVTALEQNDFAFA